MRKITLKKGKETLIKLMDNDYRNIATLKTIVQSIYRRKSSQSLCRNNCHLCRECVECKKNAVRDVLVTYQLVVTYTATESIQAFASYTVSTRILISREISFKA